MIPIIHIFLACAVLALVALAADEAIAATPLAPSLSMLQRPVSTGFRDLKALQYMENAHGQLEEWSLRLLSRLENGMGPRASDPILNGRADLQVQKMAFTYASYTQNPALSRTLGALADAHIARLVALQRMSREGVDRERYQQLDEPVQRLLARLANLS